MIPKNLHLASITKKLLRLKFPTYFHFFKHTSFKKKETKGRKKKHFNLKDFQLNYISFNQTFIEHLRSDRHYNTGNCDRLHLLQTKPFIYSASELIIIQTKTFLKKFSPNIKVHI